MPVSLYFNYTTGYFRIRTWYVKRSTPLLPHLPTLIQLELDNFYFKHLNSALFLCNLLSALLLYFFPVSIFRTPWPSIFEILFKFISLKKCTKTKNTTTPPKKKPKQNEPKKKNSKKKTQTKTPPLKKINKQTPKNICFDLTGFLSL